MIKNICVIYTHHKLGDLIWQLPYIKSISKNFNKPVTVITRSKTQAKEVLKLLKVLIRYLKASPLQTPNS